MEAGKIIPSLIEHEMKSSYLDYAMSVIVARALPDARDGLKPVHRRILYAMYDMGLLHNKPFKKSARLVGEVLGKYHPHGDMAVYDSMVRMAQEFSLRYPLVDGQGNFGSVDGDSAAAMRYTESRLKKIAEDMLADLDKDTVNFTDNFDGSLKEPSVLPAKIPNLLINGSSGIAVGMATNIPPHNIGEITEAVIKIIESPDTAVKDLIEIVKGPDFPTGGIIVGKRGIVEAYATGRGKIKVKAKTMVEEHKGRRRIIVTEIPYQVNKATLLEQIADLVKDKKVLGISDIRDESDRDGMRIIIELKKDADENVTLNQLMNFSNLQVTFGINSLALINNEPKMLGLKEMIRAFIDHRLEVTIKRINYDLTKAKEREHVLEGLIIALDDIDNIVEKIKKSKDAEQARISLMDSYNLSEIQAKAILDMKLQRLASLEQEKIKQERFELFKTIEHFKEILSSEKNILDLIKEEMQEIHKNYGDNRRTEILEEEDENLEIEDLIEKGDMVVTVTHSGYIKRLSVDTYKSQNRGGKGVIATETNEGDFVEHIFIAHTHSYILFFTNKGQVHWLKVYQLPESSRQAKGKAIVNLLEISPEEKITAMVPVDKFDNRFIIMATKEGIVKKTSLDEFSNPRKGGIRAITLQENDHLVNVVLTDGNKNILIATKTGMAVKFVETDVRSSGRTSQGVIGIRLHDSDSLVSMTIADDTKTLLTMTENGFGKRTMLDEYRLINRGGSGVISIQCSERNGNVVSSMMIDENDEIILISKNGIVIRIEARDINIIGRNTQGVKLMKLEQNDKLVSAAKVVKDQNGV